MTDEIRTHTHVTERTTVPVERVDLNREPWYAGVEPAATIRRVSWAAVLAGVVVALVVQLLLSLLGVGIGASTVDALQDQDPTGGLATRAGMWFMGTSLVAVFLGGWVAGRLAGIPRRIDSLLHGVLTWSVATLMLFFLLTSSVGNLPEFADRAAGGVTRAALMGFVVLLIGAVAGALGGALATPRDLPARTVAHVM